MANYNIGVPPNIAQYSYKYRYSLGLYLSSPTGSETTNLSWTKDEDDSDTVDLSVDYLNTSTQYHLSLQSAAYIEEESVRYEHAFFLVRLSDGTIQFNTGTLDSSFSAYSYEAWVPQTSGSVYSYTLFLAVHKRRSYIASFDLNGGTGDFSDITFLSGRTFTLPYDEPTMEGYSFLGWLFDDVLYQAGDTSPVMYVSGTLVAQWEEAPVPPIPTHQSDNLAFLEQSGLLAFRRDTNSIVYNT